MGIILIYCANFLKINFERRLNVEKLPAIELKNITKTFGKVIANKNVNLVAKRGEIL